MHARNSQTSQPTDAGHAKAFGFGRAYFFNVSNHGLRDGRPMLEAMDSRFECNGGWCATKRNGGWDGTHK
eukprot:1878934-Amphidinium_carterae.1